MAISLMWWEYEELLDHLRGRPDIWSSPRENMWMRTHSVSDDTAVVGLAISPPTKTGPYRQYVIRDVPLAWTAADSAEYLRHLVSKWTEYGQRQRYAEFLHTEAGIDLSKAGVIAIGLLALDQIGDVDPDICPVPTARELWPDVEGPDINMQYSERVLRTYGITGGGWLTIRLQGGMLRVRASLRSDGQYGGGYSGAFEGFIRPAAGNVRLAASFLYGRTMNTQGEEVDYHDNDLDLFPGKEMVHSTLTPNLRDGLPPTTTMQEAVDGTVLGQQRVGVPSGHSADGGQPDPVEPEPGSDV